MQFIKLPETEDPVSKPDSGEREVRTSGLCDVCLRGSIPCSVDPPAWLCDLKWPTSREEHFRIGYERYRNGANGPVLPLPLAQRILAALESRARPGGFRDELMSDLASELRAVVERKP